MKKNLFKLSAYKSTGNTCKDISILSDVTLSDIMNYQFTFPSGTKKGGGWKIYPFLSTDNRFHGSNTDTYIGTGVQIIDVDSTDVYDYTIRNSQSLFEHMPSALVVWPSHYGKLHLAVYTHSLVNLSGDMLKQEYAHLYRLNMSRFVEWYESSSGQTIYGLKQPGEDSDVCDTHNASVYQAIFLNHIDQYAVNDNVIDITAELISRETEYATRYPIFFRPQTRTHSKSKTPAHNNIGKTTGDEDVIYENRQPDGRYLVNRDFCLLGYRGNEARMRIATAILKAWQGQMADAIMCIQKNFVDVDNELVTALRTAGNYKVDYDVYTWVKKNIVKVYEADKTIVIGEGKWLTDYQDEIMGHIHNDKNVYIKGSCGIGKSALYRSIFESEKNVVIITHMNSVRDGVFANNDGLNDNVVLMADASKIIKSRRSLPRKMVVNWNTYVKFIEDDRCRGDFEDYIKLFDESHNLAKSLDFRHEIIYKLGMHPFNRCIFCSATPIGEHMLLGGNVVKYEFKREHERTVNYRLLKMVDEQGNKVEHRKDYDYVSTIVRYVEERYDDYDAFMVFDNRNYLLIAEEFGNHCVNFCKDNNQTYVQSDYYTDLLYSDIDTISGDMKRILDDNILTKKVIVTTTFGTEGVEIKLRETMIVNDDLTIDYETHKISKVCAIIPIWNVSTTDVKQTINRFRDVEYVDCVFVQSDDARERMIAGVGKDISLDHMSQYANNVDVYAELMGYEDMLYVDSSTNYARERLQQKPGVILALSQLQQQHKTYSSLTTNNIRLLYPDIAVEQHEYVVISESKSINATKAYNQFKSNSRCLITMLSVIADNANKVNGIKDIIEIARNYPCCDKLTVQHKPNYTDSISSLIFLRNWEGTELRKNWYDYARVVKEIQSDCKKMKAIYKYACDNDSGVEISCSVKVGIWYLCETMKRDNMLHLESVKTLLRNRYELHREHANERYTEPVGIDNEPQVKRNEERLKQYQRCLQKLLLDDDISVPNSEWISSLGNSKEVLDIYESVIQSSLYDCECNAVSSVRLDKKGRASVAQYKWQLNEDERVRFKSLKEAYDYIHPVISLATFSKKNYAQYVTRI